MTRPAPPLDSTPVALPDETPVDRTGWQARDEELRRLRRTDPWAGRAAAERWLAATSGAEAEAWAVRAYAHGLRETGAYAEALANYERAGQMFGGLKLEVERARTGLGQVWALRYLGRYEEAVGLARRTRGFLKAHGEELAAATQTLNLGAVYRRMGRLDAARRAYLEAARAFRAHGDASSEATAGSNLGNVLADLG